MSAVPLAWCLLVLLTVAISSAPARCTGPMDAANQVSDEPAINGEEDREEDEPEEFEGADFLFTLEEAYNQRRNELQVDFTFSFLSGRESEREFEWEDRRRRIEEERTRQREFGYTVNLEFGVTDRVQIGVSAPYLSIRETSADGVNQGGDWGDVELELAYALMEEQGSRPAVTWSFELGLPTGDRGDGTGSERVGYGTALAVSRDFGRWVGYLNLVYGYTPDARLQWAPGRQGPPLDLNSFEYGLGALLKLNDQWHVLLELLGETAEELELADRASTTELLLTPGIRYGVETARFGEWEAGVGFPVGLTPDSPDWGVLAKVQWEFGP